MGLKEERYSPAFALARIEGTDFAGIIPAVKLVHHIFQSRYIVSFLLAVSTPSLTAIYRTFFMGK